jgi:hypothetical protein
MEFVYPPVGELTPVEIEILDSTLPALALGNDTPLLDALEAILHKRLDERDWERYLALSPEEKQAVLDGIRSEIPLLPQN